MSSLRLRDGDRGPVLAGENLILSVDLAAGTFALTGRDGHALLVDAATATVLADGTLISSRDGGLIFAGSEAVEDTHGGGLALLLERPGEPSLSLRLTLYEDRPFLVAQSRLTNTSGRLLRVQAFQVLDGATLNLGPDVGAWRLYKEGWQNWSPALVLPCSGEDIYMSPPVVGPATQPAQRPGRFLSELVTAIVDPTSGRALTAGFVSTADQFSQLWLDRESRSLTAASYADGIELSPSHALSSERLLVEPSAQPLASLERYGDALSREMGAPGWPHVPTGWCSWYYYWQGVSEENVLANLDLLAERRGELPLEYFQVDDGYQAGIGDWLTPNEKFPHDMGWLAERIHERGFKAGLWLAPFMIGEKSRLWQEHPDWAVEYKPGRPYLAMVNWQQNCYAMDLTRPEAIEWLERVFRTVFDDWGYDYVKIDFLYAGAVDGRRHDPNVTRARAYRRGIEVVRRIAGERFILGCGHPMGPSVGIVNGSRISPDVAPFWHPAAPQLEPGRSDLSLVSTANALRNTLARSWMHGRLWLNDPDCLLARDSDTALTPDETRTLATVIALSGGMMLDSDNLARLSEEGTALISFLLPVIGRSAVPLDLFESDVPRLFELDCGSHRLLGVFNWRNEASQVVAPMPAEPTHVFEVWSRRYLGMHAGKLDLSIPAHGCRLLALRPASGRPQLVGSTFHFGQGANEVKSEEWDGRTLALSLRPVTLRRGDLFVHLPEGGPAPRVECETGVRTERRADGLLSVALTLDRPLQLALRFDSASG